MSYAAKKTAVMDAYSENFAAIDIGAQIIKNGGLVAFPTETVYGLGANALNSGAAKKIYEAKGRPSDNPLIAHVLDVDQISEIVTEIPQTAKKLLDAFSPGALTLIFNKNAKIPYESTGGLDTVAVRIPSHIVARKLIEKSGVPIAAPSANISGKPSPTNASHVIADMTGKIDMILDGGSSELGLESTVIDVTGEMPELLRPGSITVEMLETIVKLSPIKTSKTGNPPKAPGMKYKHYAPEANLKIMQNPESVAIEVKNSLTAGKKTGIFTISQNTRFYTAKFKNEIMDGQCIIITAGDGNKPETVAHNLFDALRQFDILNTEEIVAEDLGNNGLGHSIMNRLNKAAGNSE